MQAVKGGSEEIIILLIFALYRVALISNLFGFILVFSLKKELEED